MQRSFAVVMGGSYVRSEWRATGIPFIGSVDVPGARLWFGDVALRGQLPLRGESPRAPLVFLQVGPGLAHYSLKGTVLGTPVDEGATNFAVAIAAGVTLPFTERLGLEVMAKDYIASFKSVTDLASFGIEGRRAHTLLLTFGARLGL